MTGGLGLSDDLQVDYYVEESSDSSRIGEVLFDGGSDRSTATTSLLQAGHSSAVMRLFRKP